LCGFLFFALLSQLCILRLKIKKAGFAAQGFKMKNDSVRNPGIIKKLLASFYGNRYLWLFGASLSLMLQAGAWAKANTADKITFLGIRLCRNAAALSAWRGIGFILFFLFLWLTFRFLSRWLKTAVKTSRLARALHKAFSFVAQKLQWIIEEKLHISIGKNLLRGESTVSYRLDSVNAKNASEQPKKLSKWKNLTTDRERIRYLFAFFILRRRREGLKIPYSATPSELAPVLAETEEQRQIFDYYNLARYSRRTIEIGGEQMDAYLKAVKETAKSRVKIKKNDVKREKRA